LENDRAAYRVAADLDPFETKAAAGAIRESMAIFMFVIVVLSINEVCMGGGVSLVYLGSVMMMIWIWYPFIYVGSVRICF